MEKNITKVFENFNNKNILIVGDVMIDSYLLGNVSRISPEAPVPIIDIKKREDRLGGASNVALNIKSLGANPIICTVIGKDEYGTVFKNLLNKRKLAVDGVVESKQRKTTVKTRVISNAQHLIRIDDEHTNELTETEKSELLDKIKNIIRTEDIKAVIFEDYDKGVLSKEVIKDIINLAKKNNIITTVDPKRKNFLHYNNVTLFKPNLKELSEGLKMDIDKNNINDIAKSVSILKDKLNADIIFSTLSENGCYIKNSEEEHHFPAELRQIADVSGAGDTVISVASLLLEQNIPVNQIAFISNLAGGLVCEKVGVVPINKEQLLKEVLKKNKYFL